MRKFIHILALSLPLLMATSCSFFDKKKTPTVKKSPGEAAADQHNLALSQNKPIRIDQNNYGGKVLLLSNGERWEVYKKDRDHSGGWISGNLKIVKQNDYRRDGKLYYRYKIFNDATNDSVWARPLKSDN